ncbi:dolichol-phosphate mannosyltransferase subunit 3-like [Dysidea avara]|uniref:dolichol-phosphate mannosyltransferase subunit 3-like n=1 Tax=Dysidea avara TaxID=196820 RepID=UPI003326E34D
MTKLIQWLLVIGITFAVWLGLLTNAIPINASPSLQEVLYPLPLYFLICFGSYSLFIIGYRLTQFKDCTREAELLKEEIAEARKDLTSKGFRF